MTNNKIVEGKARRKRSNYYNRTTYRRTHKLNVPFSSLFLWKAVAKSLKISVNAFIVVACDDAAEVFMNEVYGRQEIDWIARVEQEMDRVREATDIDPPLPDVSFLGQLGRESESRPRPLHPEDDQGSSVSDR